MPTHSPKGHYVSNEPPQNSYATLDDSGRRVFRYQIIRFAILHALCLTAYFTGVSATDLILCGVLYVVRMFFITAGYHRYFSHRTFKLNRVMQFLFAFGAESSAQKGVLWWAANHRHHHKHSDGPEDVHSVRQGGFLWAHMLWLFDPRWEGTDTKRVKDLTKYPEIVWIDKYWLLPPTLLGIAVYALFGWSGVVVGFLWSTVLCWHVTYTINSLAHVWGSRRYDTGDDSRNNFLLAILTLGEGWHNNHHYYQASANQGFFWWEIDISYYTLWAMSKVGLVSDLRRPPQHLIEGKPHPRIQLQELRQEWETMSQSYADGVAQIRSNARARLLELNGGEECNKSENTHAVILTRSERAEAFLEELAIDLSMLGSEAEAKIDQLQKNFAELKTQAEENLASLRRQLGQELEAYELSLAN